MVLIRGWAGNTRVGHEYLWGAVHIHGLFWRLSGYSFAATDHVSTRSHDIRWPEQCRKRSCSSKLRYLFILFSILYPSVRYDVVASFFILLGGEASGSGSRSEIKLGVVFDKRLSPAIVHDTSTLFDSTDWIELDSCLFGGQGLLSLC